MTRELDLFKGTYKLHLSEEEVIDLEIDGGKFVIKEYLNRFGYYNGFNIKLKDYNKKLFSSINGSKIVDNLSELLLTGSNGKFTIVSNKKNKLHKYYSLEIHTDVDGNIVNINVYKIDKKQVEEDIFSDFM